MHQPWVVGLGGWVFGMEGRGVKWQPMETIGWPASITSWGLMDTPVLGRAWEMGCFILMAACWGVGARGVGGVQKHLGDTRNILFVLLQEKSLFITRSFHYYENCFLIITRMDRGGMQLEPTQSMGWLASVTRWGLMEASSVLAGAWGSKGGGA